MAPTITSNTRIDITIYPWAVTASDGAVLQAPLTATWITTLDPLYAHYHSVNIELGGILSELPTCTILLAIHEASKWANAIKVGECTSPDTAYYNSARFRYTTLLAAIRLMTNTAMGYSSVIEKTLGDFTVRYGDRALQKALIGRLLDELKALEPVIMGGGCYSLNAGPQPLHTVKGAVDPYRPFIARGWMPPGGADSPRPIDIYSPGWNWRDGGRLPDRHQWGTPYSQFRRW